MVSPGQIDALGVLELRTPLKKRLPRFYVVCFACHSQANLCMDSNGCNFFDSYRVGISAIVAVTHFSTKERNIPISLGEEVPIDPYFSIYRLTKCMSTPVCPSTPDPTWRKRRSRLSRSDLLPFGDHAAIRASAFSAPWLCCQNLFSES